MTEKWIAIAIAACLLGGNFSLPEGRYAQSAVPLSITQSTLALPAAWEHRPLNPSLAAFSRRLQGTDILLILSGATAGVVGETPLIKTGGWLLVLAVLMDVFNRNRFGDVFWALPTGQWFNPPSDPSTWMQTNAADAVPASSQSFVNINTASQEEIYQRLRQLISKQTGDKTVRGFAAEIIRIRAAGAITDFQQLNNIRGLRLTVAQWRNNFSMGIADPLIGLTLTDAESNQYSKRFVVRKYPVENLEFVLGIHPDIVTEEDRDRIGALLSEITGDLRAAQASRRSDQTIWSPLNDYERHIINESIDFNLTADSLEEFLRICGDLPPSEKEALKVLILKYAVDPQVKRIIEAIFLGPNGAFIFPGLGADAEKLYHSKTAVKSVASFLSFYKGWHLSDLNKYMDEFQSNQSDLIQPNDLFISHFVWAALMSQWKMLVTQRQPTLETSEGRRMIQSIRRAAPQTVLRSVEPLRWPRDRVGVMTLLDQEDVVIVFDRNEEKLFQEKARAPVHSIAVGGNVIPGRGPKGRFVFVSERVDLSQRAYLAKQLHSEKISVYSVPRAWSCLRAGRYRLWSKVPHSDYSVEVLEGSLMQDGRTRILVDEYYWRFWKQSPDYQRFLDEQGFSETDLVVIPHEFAELQLPNFARLPPHDSPLRLIFNGGAREWLRGLPFKERVWMDLDEPLFGHAWEGGSLRCLSNVFPGQLQPKAVVLGTEKWVVDFKTDISLGTGQVVQFAMNALQQSDIPAWLSWYLVRKLNIIQSNGGADSVRFELPNTTTIILSDLSFGSLSGLDGILEDMRKGLVHFWKAHPLNPFSRNKGDGWRPLIRSYQRFIQAFYSLQMGEGNQTQAEVNLVESINQLLTELWNWPAAVSAPETLFALLHIRTNLKTLSVSPPMLEWVNEVRQWILLFGHMPSHDARLQHIAA